MIFWISATAIGSIPANGSSSRMTFGEITRSRLISARRRPPPASGYAVALDPAHRGPPAVGLCPVVGAQRRPAGTVPVAAPGLRADLRVPVDDDAVGAFVERKRPADGFAVALVDDLHRRPGDHVGLVVGRIHHLRALGLTVLLAQREVLVG